MDLNNLIYCLSLIDCVEIIQFVPGIPLPGTRSLESEIISSEHKLESECLKPIKFSSHRHSYSSILTSEDKGSEFKKALQKGVNELKQYLIGSIKNYYPLYLPTKECGAIACPITINKYPVRVVQSYDIMRQGFITTFDTQRVINET